MAQPLVSIIIPTHNRQNLLNRAVSSALGQTFRDFEVIVIDDGSAQPVSVKEDPRVRLIRLEKSRGGAGARNIGTDAAHGQWITYLDDDDRLMPQMLSVSMAALQSSTLEGPVGVISSLERVAADGSRMQIRTPPDLRLKGQHFALEHLEAGRSYNTKQTLVVEREIIRRIGGWDESFRSRVHTELFLRLNLVCSIIGITEVTYQLWNHSGQRVSGNPKLRQESFHRLVQKHQDLFQAHPQRFAHFVYEHARMSNLQGQWLAALKALAWATSIHPGYVASRFISSRGKEFWPVPLAP